VLGDRPVSERPSCGKLLLKDLHWLLSSEHVKSCARPSSVLGREMFSSSSLDAIVSTTSGRMRSNRGVGGVLEILKLRDLSEP
jgi:hypothetical protein